MLRILGPALLLVYLALYLAPTARAQDQNDQAPTAASPSSGEDCSSCTLLDTPRDYLSNTLLSVSSRLDMFFSNTNTYENLNKSYAELSLNAVTVKGAATHYYGDSRVFLSMPRTQKRLNLMFQLENDGELDPDNPDITPGSPAQRTNALALRGDIHKHRNWRVTADVGYENRGGIDPFLRFSYYQTFAGKKWHWNWREAVFRFGRRGNGVTSGLVFDKEMSQKYHLRFFNQVIWYQTENYYDRSHNLNLYEILPHNNALAYSLGFYTTNTPSDSVYFLQFRYKRLFHKTWMYYEVIPEVLYAKSNHFAATPRLTLKLDIMLGN